MKSNSRTHLYGPNWQGILCGARTRGGSPCRRPGTKKNGRCRLHGGSSVGPATPSGLARLAASKTTHGQKTAAKRSEAKHRAEVVREVTRQLRQIEDWALTRGHLTRNWRDEFK